MLNVSRMFSTVHGHSERCVIRITVEFDACVSSCSQVRAVINKG